MAIISTSSSSSNFSLPSSHPSIGITLEGPNYMVWKSRFLPYLRAYELLGIVDGTELPPPAVISSPPDAAGKVSTEPNPASRRWHVRDQYALGWILSSVSDAVVTQVSDLGASHDVWTSLASSFASQNTARASTLRLQLQALKKGNSSVTTYLQQAKAITDSLAAIGKPVSSDEYQSWLFRGLGSDYSSLEVALSARAGEISREELNSLLLSHEARLEMGFQDSAPVFAPAPNAAIGKSRELNNSSHPKTTVPLGIAPPLLSTPRTGGRQNFTRHHNNRGSNRYRGTQRYGSQALPNRLQCQLCHKLGHAAPSCYQQFNQAYIPEQSAPQAHFAVSSLSQSVGHHQWIPDTGATHHITSDMDKLSLHSDFTGDS